MAKNDSEITIPSGRIRLKGNLVVPELAKAIVIFSHGSGSSRFSPRNNYVAGVLNKNNMATLLIDLLSPEEDEIYENRFNIDLLTTRLITVTRHIHQQQKFQNHRIGYFGASTGAASALRAAAAMGDIIEAIVSRGGRPDLASSALPSVKAPTLLIIGSLDEPVIEMNQEAYDLMTCEKKMVIVEGATHLFEEEGKLEEVSKLASDWFQKFLLKNNSHKLKHIHYDV